METEFVSDSAAASVEKSQRRSWSAPLAFALAWLLPGTVTRHTESTPLWAAWLLHFMGVIASTIAVFVFIAIAEPHAFDWIVRDMDKIPIQIVVATIAIALIVEIGFILFAWIVMPWGAHLERFQDSLRHALRQTWLHMGHLFLLTFIIGMVTTTLFSWNEAWRTQHPYPTIRYPSPAPAGASQQAQEQYQQAMQVYSRVWADFQSLQEPWHVRHEEEFLLLVWIAGIAWFEWSLLRGLAGRAPVERVNRPPTCDFCGYNLTATPIESLCPECGEPAVLSLGENVRRGAPWVLRDTPILERYFETTHFATLMPRWLGLQLRVLEPGTAHRRFMMLHVLPVFFVAAAGFFALLLAVDGARVLRDRDTPYIISFAGLIFATGWPLLVCLGASIVGTLMWVLNRSLVLPAAMQGACYLNALLLGWITWLWGSGVTIISLHDVVRKARVAGGLAAEELCFLIWAGFAVLTGAGFLLILWRIAAAARYANR